MALMAIQRRRFSESDINTSSGPRAGWPSSFGALSWVISSSSSARPCSMISSRSDPQGDAGKADRTSRERRGPIIRLAAVSSAPNHQEGFGRSATGDVKSPYAVRSIFQRELFPEFGGDGLGAFLNGLGMFWRGDDRGSPAEASAVQSPAHARCSLR